VAELPLIRVKNLSCPPGLDPWHWDRIVEEIGELVVARPRGTVHVQFRCTDPTCPTIHVRPVTMLDYDADAIKKLVALIQGDDDGWQPEGGDSWKVEGSDDSDDERTFGPEPNWWKG